jgi:hypothetical protein
VSLADISQKPLARGEAYPVDSGGPRAYRNDPLVDVAIMTDSLAPSPELEGVLLQACLGRAPDEALCDRLASIRALTRLYFAGVLLSASAAASWAAPDANLPATTVPEFRQAIREGRLAPGASETKHVMGKMFLTSFFSGAAGIRRRRLAIVDRAIFGNSHPGGGICGTRQGCDLRRVISPSPHGLSQRVADLCAVQQLKAASSLLSRGCEMETRRTKPLDTPDEAPSPYDCLA